MRHIDRTGWVEELATAIREADEGETIAVFSVHAQQLAERAATRMGRQDVRFVVSEPEPRGAPCER